MANDEPIRDQATQAMIALVGEQDFFDAVYQELPPEARLAMLACKAQDHDAAWIDAFRRAGAFELRQDTAGGVEMTRAGQWEFHPWALPPVEALAHVLWRSEDAFHMESCLGAWVCKEVMSSGVSPSFGLATVFQALVQDFVRSLDPCPVSPAHVRAATASAAELLCIAVAFSDVDSVEALCAATPQAMHTPVRMSMVEGARSDAGNRWVTPAYVAMHFNLPDVLDVMVRHGWSITEPVLFKRTPPQSTSENPVLSQESSETTAFTAEDLVVQALVGQEGKSVADGNMGFATLDRLLQMLRQHDPQHATACSHRIEAAACEYAGRHDFQARSLVLQALDDHDFMPSPASVRLLAVTGARAFNLGVLGRQRQRIDWAALTDQEFLPYVAAHCIDPNGATATQRVIVAELCRWSVEAGHGRRLADRHPGTPHGQHSPLLHLLAQHGITDGVLLALEQGADPSRQDPRGQTAVQCAEAAGHADTAAVLRSFAAKRAAAAALSDVPIPHP